MTAKCPDEPSTVGLNDGQVETFPPVSCKVEDPNVVAIARVRRQLWVSGIVTEALGGTVFLEICEISFSEEQFVRPAPWKLHHPKQ